MTDIRFFEGAASDVLEQLHGSAGGLRDRLSIDTAVDQDIVLVAQFADEVVGYLAARDRPDGLVVWEHVVVPDFRDRGVGRRLLLEAAKRTPPMSRLTIDPTGDFAIAEVAAYYSGLGFPPDVADKFKISVLAHQVVDAVGERLEEETTLYEILRRKPGEVVTIHPGAPIMDALALQVDMHVGSVLVSTDGETIEGILSERDIVLGIHERGPAFLDTLVQDHMTSDVISAETSEFIADAMELMSNRRLRHLPVTDGGKLVGVVSVGDLLVFRMREHDMRRDAVPHRNQPRRS